MPASLPVRACSGRNRLAIPRQVSRRGDRMHPYKSGMDRRVWVAWADFVSPCSTGKSHTLTELAPHDDSPWRPMPPGPTSLATELRTHPRRPGHEYTGRMPSRHFPPGQARNVGDCTGRSALLKDRLDALRSRAPAPARPVRFALFATFRGYSSSHQSRHSLSRLEGAHEARSENRVRPLPAYRTRRGTSLKVSGSVAEADPGYRAAHPPRCGRPLWRSWPSKEL